MEFTTSGDTPASQSVTPEPKNHFYKLANIEKLKSTRYSGDKPRNNSRNIPTKAVVDALNQQKD